MKAIEQVQQTARPRNRPRATRSNQTLSWAEMAADRVSTIHGGYPARSAAQTT